MEKTLESELVRLAKAGNMPAFETLYRTYNSRVYNFALQLVGSAEDARDLTQEAFIRAWSALPTLRSNETFGVWLHRIVFNLSKDLVRKRNKQRSFSLDGDNQSSDGEPLERQFQGQLPGPEESAVANEVEAAVRKAVDSLSSDHRIVVTMHHFEGMDVDSIASVLRIPRGTVMSRLSRAREILRRKLIPYVEEG